jgi:TIR domain
MAEFFFSYTSSDRQWAEWIGQCLQDLGHTPRLHDWEVPAGGDIGAWRQLLGSSSRNREVPILK